MPYTQFSIEDLKDRFQINFNAGHLFGASAINSVEPSEWLTASLERGKLLGFTSEKSRSERLVSPILTDLFMRNDGNFTIYSGLNLNVNPQIGLNGECDFVLSYSNFIDYIEKPIFCITEAKRQDIEEGSVQCAAQLIAARIFNEKDDYHFPILYGCTTSGTEWRFLTYENDSITFDIDRYYITELPKLLGILQMIIDTTQSYRTKPANS